MEESRGTNEAIVYGDPRIFTRYTSASRVPSSLSFFLSASFSFPSLLFPSVCSSTSTVVRTAGSRHEVTNVISKPSARSRENRTFSQIRSNGWLMNTTFRVFRLPRPAFPPGFRICSPPLIILGHLRNAVTLFSDSGPAFFRCSNTIRFLRPFVTAAGSRSADEVVCIPTWPGFDPVRV